MTAPHVQVVQTRSFSSPVSSSPQLFVLADKGLEGEAKRVLAVHQA
jgi:hypothetical protein